MTISFKGAHFLQDIMLTGVRWYVAYPLSYRHVEELMEERGVSVDHATIQRWVVKYSPLLEAAFHCRKHLVWVSWRMDEVFLTINGKRHYLWRAVDQDDHILDILVQSRRNKQAAKKFFRKLLKGLPYVPRVVITDKLKSYGAAKREMLPRVAHRQSRSLNNRCEHSHRPTRQREYRMQGCKSPGHAQRFLSAYGPIAQHLRPKRHLLSASAYRDEMGNRFASWAEITGTERAA
jgi:putative transposase